MDKLLTFRRTQIPSKTKIQRHVWKETTQLFEEGKHLDSFLHLFDYVDKDLIAKRGNADKTEFNVPHGSVIVNIKIAGDEVKVNVPFLKLPEKNKIPLLRRINEINFSPLNLASITLEGDELRFNYSTTLKMCEPWKMYYVFREICINADNYDDEFIDKFGAIRLREPNVEYFPEIKQDEIWNNFRSILEETKQYVNFFEDKRIPGFVWDALLQLFFTIDYLIAPQGEMRTNLEQVVSFMQNRNYSIQEKIDKGKNYFNELQNISKEKLCSNLYLSDVFIPVKNTTTIEQIRETFQNQYETAKKEMANNDFMGAALSIRYIFLYQFYYSYGPDDVMETIAQALEKSSGQPWDQAAGILWDAMNQVMNGQTTQSGSTGSSGWGQSSSSWSSNG